MANQMSGIMGKVGSFAHEIETDGSRHHGVRIEMIAMAAGGGATDHKEEEDANMEWIIEVQNTDADGGEGNVHMAGILDSIETDHHEAVHIDITTTGGGGGGATEEEEATMERAAVTEDDPPIPATPEEIVAGTERGTITNPINKQQPVQGNRDSGIFPNISTVTLSVSTVASFQPTPKGLDSITLLIEAYDLNIITLLVLGIVLYGLTFALDHVPDNWVPAVRAAATTVTVVLLVLLLLLVAFVAYGLVH